MSLDWGSVADWVSGIGSIGASVVALWLASNQKRALREADRPLVSCKLERGGGKGWVEVFLSFDNPSSKQWRCVKAEVLRPRHGLIVDQYDARDEKGDNPFSEAARDANAAQTLDLDIEIGPIGSAAPAWRGGGRGNFTYRRFYAKGSKGTAFRLRVTLESNEPVPDRFQTVISREI